MKALHKTKTFVGRISPSLKQAFLAIERPAPRYTDTDTPERIVARGDRSNVARGE